jgi:glycosyltransferase involved in cell wall biosynthesis
VLTVALVAYPFAPVDADPVGGAEQILSALDRALIASGHRSLVLACRGSSTAGELVEIDVGAGPITAARRAAATAQYRARLEELVRRGRVDLIHFHGIDCFEYVPANAGPARVAQLVTLHLPIDWYGPALLRAPPALSFNCVSEAQRARAPSELALGRTIENGVDLERWRPTPAIALDHDACLGRICPEKGFELALAAAHRTDRTLWLAGQTFAYPEHERYFAEQIQPLLDDQRRYLGPIHGEAKRRFLAGARCLIVPSRVAETSSLVTMEALACGTPVIVGRAGAPRTLIEPGVTGFVADDERELAEALTRVHRLERGACREAAERRFDLRRTTRAYLELYEQLVLEAAT